MINMIAKITIYVDNQEEAKKFWVDKLGFVVAFEQAMGPAMTWLEVAPNHDAQTTLVLYNKAMMIQQNPATSVAHPSIILSTDNIEKAYETMKQNQVEVGELQIMPYGKMFTFKDQDNNEYLLRED